MTHGSPPSFPLNYAHPSADGPAPDDNAVTRMMAWLVIIGCVIFLGLSNYRQAKTPATGTAAARPGMPLELIGRYVVGAHSLTAGSPQADSSAKLMVAQLDGAAATPADKLAAAAIIGELQGKADALARLDALKKPLPASLQPQADALRVVYSQGPSALSAGQRNALMENLGWFGRLALTFDQPADNPERATLIAHARGTMWIAFGAAVGVAALGLVGLITAVIVLILVVNGWLPLTYRPSYGGGGIFLEAFAIYIGGMTAAGFVAHLLPRALQNNLAAHLGLMIGPTIVAIAWPLIRGVEGGRWRNAIGWHAGRGAFREMGLGLVGYVAGIPVLAAGFLITIIFVNVVHAHPSHPVERMLGVSPQLTFFVFMLAGVYAPITEETMFRGAFFHSLRARHRWLLSAIVSSFIFAAIHPQGWTVVPTLMAIAVVFAGIREWRGTIFSSAAAHCLHNTVLLTLATLMMRVTPAAWDFGELSRVASCPSSA